MHAISRRPIREFIERHPDAAPSLTLWWRLATHATWRDLAETRQDWRSADYVSGLTVFNIAGNTYRLVAYIDYEAQVILVRGIYTHQEYDQKGWHRDPYYRG
jgi:mRNA interferase HigB